MSRSPRRPASAPASTPPANHANPVAQVLSPIRPPASPDTAPTPAGLALPPAGPNAALAVLLGVGIDTSRYGHHASFLDAHLDGAAADLDFAESGPGYQLFRQRLDQLVAKHGHVHFHFRVDVAGRYADNLLAFLYALPYPKTISCGDPQRNKNYKVAIYGHKKSDPVESLACARFALTEKPKAAAAIPPELRLLGHIASRLEAQTRQCTRYTNQLHNLLASAFPELALLVKDISTGWILKLLDHYPTAAKLAAARPSALEKIPYLPHKHIPALLESARTSVASLTGPVAEQLVKDHVQQVKDAHARQNSLEKLLVEAYRRLPFNNHLDSIIGFGEVTAAVLTAKIIDPWRFVLPKNVIGFFGIYPVQASSGIDRDGQPRAPVRMIMCPRGNDLVRRYLYMASLSAIQHNPAVQPVYLRVLAKHPDQAGIALGHVMAKLLKIALAVWKSGKPFDPAHYNWDQAAHLPGSIKPGAGADLRSNMSAAATHAEQGQENAPAAGHNKPALPERKVVTAAERITTVDKVPKEDATGTPESDIPMSLTASANDMPRENNAVAKDGQPWIDFAHVKSQLPLQRVLEHLGLVDNLKGRGRQRRGPCPVHEKDGKRKGRTFAVHLDKNAFYCFHPHCGIKGDVLDLWARLKGLSLRQAAVELVQIFNLEPAPGTEKRNG